MKNKKTNSNEVSTSINFKLLIDKYLFMQKYGQSSYDNMFSILIDKIEQNEGLLTNNKNIIGENGEKIKLGELPVYDTKKIELLYDNNFFEMLESRNNYILQSLNKVGYETEKMVIKNDEKLILGLGETSIADRSIKLHHVYGIPYIPSSSIKGICSSYIKNEVKNGGKIVKDLFGDDSEKGKVIFLDTFPKNKISLKNEIISPKYKEYFEKDKMPIASKSIPIKFLAIGEETEFNLCFASSSLNYKKHNIKKWILEALFNYGLGAKTNVGFGHFQCSNKSIDDSRKIVVRADNVRGEFRVSQIKSSMRFWWRSLIGVTLASNIRELKKLESEYFGDAKTISSPFGIRVFKEKEGQFNIKLYKKSQFRNKGYSIEQYESILKLSLILGNIGEDSNKGKGLYYYDLSNRELSLENIKNEINSLITILVSDNKFIKNVEVGADRINKFTINVYKNNVIENKIGVKHVIKVNNQKLQENIPMIKSIYLYDLCSKNYINTIATKSIYKDFNLCREILKTEEYIPKDSQKKQIYISFYRLNNDEFYPVISVFDRPFRESEDN